MVNTILAVIRSGRFDLATLIERIEYYFAAGQLTADDKDRLIDAARQKAIEAMGVDARTEILSLWAVVREMQKEIAEIKHRLDPDPGPDPEPEIIPEWVQPTGAHDAYQKGDKVRYKGEVYECLIDNNVWAPDVYPAGWQQLLQEETPVDE